LPKNGTRGRFCEPVSAVIYGQNFLIDRFKFINTYLYGVLGPSNQLFLSVFFRYIFCAHF
jgi:hypothetical protein